MTKLLFSWFYAGLFLFALTQNAFAFPELSRHGYSNCISCHVSPSGGGALTAYGRQLSAEVLSTWSREGEGEFVYNLVKLPEWLSVGGDTRAVEIHRDTPQVSAYRFLFMQTDFEAAVTYGKITADFRMGAYMEFRDVQSRQFYLNYRPRDELSFRAGKFQTAYGLMEPDHTTAIRRGLGWDEGTESYNVEAAWLGDFSVYATADLGPLDSDVILAPNRERGAALRVALPFLERFQIGASYFHGFSNVWNRDVAGPFGTLAFTKRFFLLTEMDYENTRFSDSSSQKGWVTWNKLDYELVQGAHAYLMYQLVRPDFLNSAAQTSAWGLGSQFFPRPHFEFDLLWQFQSVPAFPTEKLSYATLLMHYYW